MVATEKKSVSTPTQTQAVAAPASSMIDGAVLDTMMASALSGMIARIPLHPIDTCKAKLQVQQNFLSPHSTFPLPTAATPAASSAASTISNRSFFQFFSHTLRTEGVRGLYSGFGITFLGSAPAACLYFTSYEASKSFLSSIPVFQNAPTFFSHFLSGLLAESASCVLWVPIDVVKERLQVQQQLKEIITSQKSSTSAAAAASSAHPTSPGSPSASGAANPNHPPATLYRGNLHAIATIARTEGIRGVYRAYGATVASFGPFSAIYLSGYEQFKELFAKLLLPASTHLAEQKDPSHLATESSATMNAKVELPFYGYAMSGACAGGVASVLTNPLDLVKLRMQVQRGNTGFTFGYRNIFHGLQKIVEEEGVKALFKGAGARCMFHIPSTALTIAMFDTLRNYLTRIRTSNVRHNFA